MDREVPKVLRSGGVYEPATLKLIRRKLAGGDVIAGGGFVGDFFPAISEALAPGRLLHSFEPNPVSHASALLTIGLNGLTNICLHRVAVGEASGRMHLQVATGHDKPMAARARIVDAAREDQTIEVAMRRLDDLVPPGRRVTVLQLDIEGHEWPAILGASRIIRENRPMILLEANRPRRQRQYQRDLKQKFPELGYRMVGALERNGIFLPIG
ncbi:hypothetical protein ATO6_03520 [Oceanicola sp. 22II-s10i]|uniref:FkbM family methyltransferase n=1 Tax=Oceanicola sp. 22II-s10i TaxID=1317116 RepID=UPI000B65A344|nr:FkbM family methyltransferase [Oceanicola sp. 22II-s10i]OWU85957.1 hypothetical protein ATO6_03520 [Oceanicola sp. 22II-s10i]